jgi:putative FmdB family regulatory protein
MPILLFDYECPQCQTIEERMVSAHDEVVTCEKCGATMTKVFISAGTRLPDDAPWLKTVLEVVAKDSTKPATREFLKNPTRENYRKWMKAEGIRPLEPGEYESRKKARAQEETTASKRRVDFMMRRHMERKAIVVGGR